MYPTYAAAYLAAVSLFGENWYLTRSIVPRFTPMALPGYYHVAYLVSTRAPSKGSIRA